MRHVCRSLLPLLGLSLALLLGVAPATAALPAARRSVVGAGWSPGSMASLGDSITRGFNACGFYLDCPSRSFGTGDDPAVNSHYLRLLAANPAIAGHAFNDARSGAKAMDLPGQAGVAVAQGAEYVTVLIGANDACAPSEAAMTGVQAFRGYLNTALATLRAGLPSARVLLISIPDLRRLWEVAHGSLLARGAWGLLRFCQSMLARPTSTAPQDMDRRARVRQRVIDYNAQLADACAGYGPNCAFDGNAVFNYPFTLDQVSGWDYFHPNASGQAILASVSWRSYVIAAGGVGGGGAGHGEDW